MHLSFPTPTSRTFAVIPTDMAIHQQVSTKRSTFHVCIMYGYVIHVRTKSQDESCRYGYDSCRGSRFFLFVEKVERVCPLCHV